jgi:hypothetical protein
MAAPDGRRSGTSLLEVIIALAVGGSILLCGRMVMEQLADAARRTIDSGAEVESGINAERLLRAAVASTESATIVSFAVRGAPDHADIETWCDVPAGWQERCRFEIHIVQNETENQLIAVFGSDTVVVRRRFGTGALRYIADAAHGGSWRTEWISQITSPVALEVILDADTLILRIGERG